jgi:hypothetical protein
VKQGELHGAEDRLREAKDLAMVLKQRRDEKAGEEQLQEAQRNAEVAVEQAMALQADIREVKVRVAQMESLSGDPRLIEAYFDRQDRSGSPLALERRMKELERKLGQVLQALEGAKRRDPVGSFPPQRR